MINHLNNIKESIRVGITRNTVFTEKESKTVKLLYYTLGVIESNINDTNTFNKMVDEYLFSKDDDIFNGILDLDYRFSHFHKILRTADCFSNYGIDGLLYTIYNNDDVFYHILSDYIKTNKESMFYETHYTMMFNLKQ